MPINPKLLKKYTLVRLEPNANIKEGDIIAFEYNADVDIGVFTDKWLEDVERTAFLVKVADDGLEGEIQAQTLDKRGGSFFGEGTWKITLYTSDWESSKIYKLVKRVPRDNHKNQRLADLIL